jgi:hypothetical protein
MFAMTPNSADRRPGFREANQQIHSGTAITAIFRRKKKALSDSPAEPTDRPGLNDVDK